MTPTVEELRRWSAEELMGWHEEKDGSWSDHIGNLVFIPAGWAPDLSSSPIAQILEVIEKMRGLGWFISIDNSWERELKLWMVTFATEKQIDAGSITSYCADANLQTAVLQAAYAAPKGCRCCGAKASADLLTELQAAYVARKGGE